MIFKKSNGVVIAWDTLSDGRCARDLDNRAEMEITDAASTACSASGVDHAAAEIWRAHAAGAKSRQHVAVSASMLGSRMRPNASLGHAENPLDGLEIHLANFGIAPCLLSVSER